MNVSSKTTPNAHTSRKLITMFCSALNLLSPEHWSSTAYTQSSHQNHHGSPIHSKLFSSWPNFPNHQFQPHCTSIISMKSSLLFRNLHSVSQTGWKLKIKEVLKTQWTMLRSSITTVIWLPVSPPYYLQTIFSCLESIISPFLLPFPPPPYVIISDFLVSLIAVSSTLLLVSLIHFRLPGTHHT